MADLTTVFAGIRSPNPFWLASGPPTNCGARDGKRAAQATALQFKNRTEATHG